MTSAAQSALIVLSPLEPRYLAPESAISLARDLKQRGISRADLTSNIHFAQAAQHGAYGVAPFRYVAGTVAELFENIVGNSRMYDLDRAMESSLLPGVNSLLTVAANCLHHIDGNMPRPHERDVRDLAMVLYAAIHAGGYDRMVFPHLGRRVRDALMVISHGVRGLSVGHYGQALHLDALRGKIADVTPNTMPAPGQRLN